MYAMSVSTEGVKSPTEPVHAESYQHVLETPDSTEPQAEDADSVAMVMGKDSTDVICDNARREKMTDTLEDSWDSEPEDAASAAVMMDKDSADVVETAPDNKEVVESWDSEDEEEKMNSRKK